MDTQGKRTEDHCLEEEYPHLMGQPAYLPRYKELEN
jgi:hypothetical protein